MLARFCPSCGHASEPFEQEGHARARCPSCGFIDYANPKPAVGAILAREGRVLLSRRAREPHQGLWDLPGGFVERGERAEDAIVRELAEETGLRARVMRLVLTAPGTYQGHATLNLVWLCDAQGEPQAASDSAELRWHDPRRLPEMAFPHEAEGHPGVAALGRKRVGEGGPRGLQEAEGRGAARGASSLRVKRVPVTRRRTRSRAASATARSTPRTMRRRTALPRADQRREMLRGAVSVTRKESTLAALRLPGRRRSRGEAPPQMEETTHVPDPGGRAVEKAEGKEPPEGFEPSTC